MVRGISTRVTTGYYRLVVQTHKRFSSSSLPGNAGSSLRSDSSNPELVASSSRSQVAACAASVAALLTRERPSANVRWRPPLTVAIVTHLVTQLSTMETARSSGDECFLERLSMVRDPRQNNSGMVGLGTPAMNNSPVAGVTGCRDRSYRADHACVVFDDPEDEPLPVLPAICVQQRPDARSLNGHRRAARAEIQQTGSHQGQVFDAWPWCCQVPVQKALGRTPPEDKAAARLIVGSALALLIPDRLAYAAVDLLCHVDLTRLGMCPADADGCGWLFLDHSRNHSRRWCVMDGSCGAQVKARRLTERRRTVRAASKS
jgi:hypothetical protein